MSDSVLVVVADEAYLQHAKAMLAGCRRQGNWSGDVLLLTDLRTDTSEIEQRRIDIMRVDAKRYSMKFHLFSPRFQKWKRLLYLDCDCVVQGDLNEACDTMAERFPLVLCDSQQTSILADWRHFDERFGSGPDSHPELYDRLQKRYPYITDPIFVTSLVCFCPDSIPTGTLSRLLETQEEFQEANPAGCDQQVLCLVLHGQIGPAGKGVVTWFAFDYPENRVPSPERGWTGQEVPAVVHYWSMYAPWIVKEPGAGGYLNHRLNRVCHELYAENLAAFEKEFPRV